MKRPTTLLLLIMLALTLGACARTASAQESSQFTGFLESDTITLAPETSGRILELLVDEGDAVVAGQHLARIDNTLLQRQLASAQTDVAAAQARLAQLKAAVRPQQLELAQTQVDQAQAAASAAETALQDAIRLRHNPQMLDVQIAQAQAALGEARAHARAAKHRAQAADWEAQMWSDIVHDLSQKQRATLPDGQVIEVDAPADKKHQASVQWQQASNQAWLAWQHSAQADAAAEQAQTALRTLRAQRDDVQQAEAQVVAATNARDQALAAVQQAQAAMAVLKSGASPAQIRAAAAAVNQAQAARDALAATDHALLCAPAAGIIAARYFAAGEVIAAGQRLFALDQPQHIHITIYMPASRIDEIAVGQSYSLSIENSAKRYTAHISAIADAPEFTMRQSQNNAERAAVVYAVTLQVDDRDDSLRPGTPATIHIATTQP